MSPVLDRSSAPAPGPPPPLHLPRFERSRLSNGIELYVAPVPKLPEVSLRLVLEAGAGREPAELAGVAELTGRLLSEGAGGMGAIETAAWLDRIGALFHASVSYDVTMASMYLLSEVLDEALEFLATVVRRPDLAPHEVERVRDERLDEIERQRDEPAIVAGHALIGAIYGGHPYGRPSGGVRETVDGLDPGAVTAFHRGAYGPEGAALIACGDVEHEALHDRLEELFGDWEGGTEAGALADVPPRPLEAGRILLVDRPESAQSEVRLGTVGAPRDTGDYFPLVMANMVLGGLFSSRINRNLREEKGWTYGARSSFRMRRGAGPFVAGAAVETQATGPALGEMVSEIRGMVEEPPTDEEMELARNALTLSLPRHFETVIQMSRKVSQQVIYGLAEDFWEHYREGVESVTREQVVSAVERYLVPEELVLVAVGAETSIRSQLEELGVVELRGAP